MANALSWCCKTRRRRTWRQLRKGLKKKAKARRSKDKKPKAQRPWVIDRYLYKEDEIGYLERLRTHLYVFDLAGKTLTQVTSGDFDDKHPAWSPDGKYLAFSSNRSTPDAGPQLRLEHLGRSCRQHRQGRAPDAGHDESRIRRFAGLVA